MKTIFKKHSFLYLLLALILLFGAGLHPALAITQPVNIPAIANWMDTRINLIAWSGVNYSDNAVTVYLPFIRNDVKWQIEDVGNIVGYSVSLGLDTDGSPHISYTGKGTEITDPFTLQYANRIGGQWNHEVAADMALGGESKLKLNSANQPFIAYTACNLWFCPLFIAQKEPNIWKIQDLDPNISGASLSIDLDSNGRPHLSFCKQSTVNQELRHMYWSGSQWITEIVDLGCWYGTSIRLDSQDHARISYYMDGSGDLKYAEWTGDSWAIDAIDTAGDVGLWNNLGLDSRDLPSVAYLDNLMNTIKYAKWNGSSWEILSVDSTSSEFIVSISLAIDSKDQPHIAYDGLLGTVRYAFWSGQDWSIWNVDFGGFPSLALDANDLPHIVYQSGNLKYAQAPTSLHISR